MLWQPFEGLATDLWPAGVAVRQINSPHRTRVRGHCPGGSGRHTGGWPGCSRQVPASPVEAAAQAVHGRTPTGLSGRVRWARYPPITDHSPSVVPTRKASSGGHRSGRVYVQVLPVSAEGEKEVVRGVRRGGTPIYGGVLWWGTPVRCHAGSPADWPS